MMQVQSAQVGLSLPAFGGEGQNSPVLSLTRYLGDNSKAFPARLSHNWNLPHLISLLWHYIAGLLTAPVLVPPWVRDSQALQLSRQRVKAAAFPCPSAAVNIHQYFPLCSQPCTPASTKPPALAEALSPPVPVRFKLVVHQLI